MLYVIDAAGFGMILTELIHPRNKVASMIATFSGHSCFCRGFFELADTRALPNNISVGLFHRQKHNWLHIFMSDTLPRRRQTTKTNAKNYKTLLCPLFFYADLDGVINDPYPV
jgi:hypothetical protein